MVKGRRGSSRCWINIHINGIFLNICQKSFCFMLCNNSTTTTPQSPGGRSWRDKGEKMIDSRGKILDGWLSLSEKLRWGNHITGGSHKEMQPDWRWKIPARHQIIMFWAKLEIHPWLSPSHYQKWIKSSFYILLIAVLHRMRCLFQFLCIVSHSS